MPTPVPTSRAPGRRRPPLPERGAVIVEFALVLPVLLLLILGTFTAGIAYNRSQDLSHAAREASRFGATLPAGATWVSQVEAVAVANAAGSLEAGVAGRTICVALLDGAAVVHSSTGSACFADGLTGQRVQVVTGADAVLDAFIFSRTLNLRQQATAAFEARP
jgi:Flp pilus assembly protein TadG